MPADHDLLEQLESYGDWLRTAIDLEPTRSDDVPVLAVAPLPRRRWGWIGAAAAAALVAVAVGGFLARSGDGSDLRSAPTTVAPAQDGSIFVLAAEGIDLDFGSVSDASDVPSDMTGRVLYPLGGIVVGRPVPGGFIDVMTVTATDSKPERTSLPGLDEDRTELPDGGWTANSLLGAELVTQRGERWLEVEGASGQDLSRVLTHVSVQPDGGISLRDGGGFEVLTELFPVGIDSISNTYAEARLPAGERVVVEAVAAGIPMPAVVVQADWIGPAEVRGMPGWHALVRDADVGTDTLMWTEQGVGIFLSGAPLETLMEVAEGLRFVDEATWREATDAEDV